MVDIYSFLATLKISWLRRLSDSMFSSSEWPHLYPALHKLDKFGSEYIKVCIKEIDNPFWRHVLKHVEKISGIIRNQEIELNDIFDEPIFYNINIKRGKKTIYIKEWETLGILRIKDVLDDNDQCMDYVSFKEKYIAPNSNFMLYFGIITAIKTYLNNIKRNAGRYKNLLSKELWVCIRAGNNSIKKKLTEDNMLPTSTAKWNSQFERLNWKTIFTNCFKFSPDTQLQWFQTRLLHRILPTKKYLALCKLTDSSACSFCGQETETLNHLFWNCIHVQKFWNDFLELLKEKCIHCARFNLNEQLVLFGSSDNTYTDKPINFIILFAKFYIYKSKFQSNIPLLRQFLQQMRNRYNIEKLLAFRNNKAFEFERDWQLYFPLLEHGEN